MRPRFRLRRPSGSTSGMAESTGQLTCDASKRTRMGGSYKDWRIAAFSLAAALARPFLGNLSTSLPATPTESQKEYWASSVEKLL